MKKKGLLIALLASCFVAFAQPTMEINGAPPAQSTCPALASGGGLFNGASNSFFGSSLGTSLGVNTPVANYCNLFDVQQAGVSRFKIGPGIYPVASTVNDILINANWSPTTGSGNFSQMRFTTTFNSSVTGEANVLDFRPTVTLTQGDFRVINIDYTHVINNNKSDDVIRIVPRISSTAGVTATQWGIKGYTQILGAQGSWFSNAIHLQGYIEINSTDTSSNTIGKAVYGSVEVSNSGRVNEIIGGVFGARISHASGRATSAFGIKTILEVNDGTITNTYGVYVDDVTKGTQTNQAYGIYVSDVNARNYFGQKTGFGIAAPVSYVDILGATLTGSDAFPTLNIAQTWNTSGNPTAFKMNVTKTASGSSSLLMDIQLGGVTQFNIDDDGNATGIVLKATSALVTTETNGTIYGGNGRMIAPAGNGIFTMTNGAQNDFNRLTFGGTTSAYPSIKRNGSGLRLRLADDSGDATLEAGNTTINSVLTLTPITATAASALTPGLGMFVVVNSTNVTFTSTGLWFYNGTAWVFIA